MNKVTINMKENKSEETLLTVEIWELFKVLTIWGTKRIWQTVRNLAVLGAGVAWVCSLCSPDLVSSHYVTELQAQEHALAFL